MKPIEFYTTPEGEVTMRPLGEAERQLRESDTEFIQAFLEILREFYTEAYTALMEIYSKSSENKRYRDFLAVRRFIKCNFGLYDNVIDIDENWNFRFEFVGCPLRRDAQKEAMNLARIGNKYLADTEPWKLAKTDMERVGTILNISLQLVANLAIAFEPFLPFSSERLRQMLNMDSFDWAELGRNDLLPAGHQLNKPELLFEKIEDATIEAQVQKLLDTKKANEEANYKAKPIRANIEFDDFMKLDIRVGTVLECQKVPKADKLLQFKIDDGLETRTIVSGIAQHYKPEELVGKQVCFIANLAPRKLKGIVSEGMILSAENNDGSLAVVMPGREVKPGSEVK